MIENININQIYPHPDNPRKDLGDLSELSDSIKSNGVMQNLTVVITPDGYRVIIGHRRLAAAKLAGLTEVPCAISDMDHKQQVATMLTENMQRSDLTFYEQAQGIQMLLDFGETVDNISKQTGFSENTIRRRVKLLALDQDKFKKSVERGATLQDYAELDKIRDIELRNSVLEVIGTGNFQWKLKATIEQEAREQLKAKLLEKIKTFATQVESDKGLICAHYFSYTNSDPEKCIPADAREKQYFFLVGSYDIRLFEKKSSTNNGQALESDNYRKMRERCNQLDEINKRAYQLRKEFIQDFRPKKQHANIIMEFAARRILDDGGDYIDNADVLEMLGGKQEASSTEADDDDMVPGFEEFAEFFAASPEKVLLTAVYVGMDGSAAKFHDWQGNHRQNESLETVYDILERLGYQISHEESALIDGTHELYVRENVPRCRICGCTDDHACPGGCSWVEPDLCSACAEETEK